MEKCIFGSGKSGKTQGILFSQTCGHPVRAAHLVEDVAETSGMQTRSRITNDPYEDKNSESAVKSAVTKTQIDDMDHQASSSKEGTSQAANKTASRQSTPPPLHPVDSEDMRLIRMMNVVQTLAINDANFTPKQFEGH